jgi:GNAT superfamily N-acetyltransferase
VLLLGKTRIFQQMVNPIHLIKASLDAGREFLRPPSNDDERMADKKTLPSVVVPIRSLGINHRGRIADHLKSLNDADRYSRFGYLARDEQIQKYVDTLNFERDDIFGIYNRRLELIAMAHLAYTVNPEFKACAEFGVSVRSKARGRGYGARLFERATIHARNEGVELLFVHALSQNTAMLKIARNAGAVVERDGTESEAFLRLPPATLDSRIAEIMEEQFAQTDYRLKIQAKHFWDFLESLQSMRQGKR